MSHSIRHLKKGKIIIDLDADWSLYTDAIPQGSIALGVITQEQQTGALVYFEESQEYLMIQSEQIYRLLAYKVRAAIQQAQRAPAELESEPINPLTTNIHH